MKRQRYILMIMIISLFALIGCGKITDNRNNTTDGVLPTQSKNIGTEQMTADDEKSGSENVVYDYPPCVMIDNILYQDTGYVSSMIGCGNMDGEIESTVDGTHLPTENIQSNFGTGYQYQRGDENHVVVMIDDEKRIFRNMEAKDRSIPKQVMNFTAKVKEITENGALQVSYISVAEGFMPMSEGEYFVPADNLRDEVQVGDVVTIWFNGNIMETAPAQLGTVYRIEKSE